MDVRKLDLEPVKKEVVEMTYMGGLWDVKCSIETTMYHSNDRKYEFHAEDRDGIQRILKDLQTWLANIAKMEEGNIEIVVEMKKLGIDVDFNP